MTATTERSHTRAFAVILSVLATVVICAGTLGGYWVGRRASAQLSEDLMKVAVASGSPISLYEALAMDPSLSADDPALAEIYGVPAANTQALTARLREIVWVPGAQPAPFVGHIGRPIKSGNLRINEYGFRDDRQSYAKKPAGTLRVFITGGSTAWGSGAPDQERTISYLLEQTLNATFAARGVRYEVINAAFPAWATTQEKLLTQQVIARLQPDVVIMLSGNNDVHWSHIGEDIRWFFSYTDKNFVTMLNGLYHGIGQLDWMAPTGPENAPPRACETLGPLTAANAAQAAFALAPASARLVFALQPNLMTTAKPLSAREQRVMRVKWRDYWRACYAAMAAHLQRLDAGNYQFLDLSRAFGEADANTEVFIDSYHFAERGNRLLANALAGGIDWASIKPAAR